MWIALDWIVAGQFGLDQSNAIVHLDTPLSVCFTFFYYYSRSIFLLYIFMSINTKGGKGQAYHNPLRFYSNLQEMFHMVQNEHWKKNFLQDSISKKVMDPPPKVCKTPQSFNFGFFENFKSLYCLKSNLESFLLLKIFSIST